MDKNEFIEVANGIWEKFEENKGNKNDKEDIQDKVMKKTFVVALVQTFDKIFETISDKVHNDETLMDKEREELIEFVNGFLEMTLSESVLGMSMLISTLSNDIQNDPRYNKMTLQEAIEQYYEDIL